MKAIIPPRRFAWLRTASAFACLAACDPGVPDAPSFQEHVMPILAANCIRCHGAPALGGAPPTMRLDSYADLGDAAGAATYAPAIAQRIVDPERPMPPRFPLDDEELETLQRWARAPERGAPRPGNRAPTITVEGTPMLRVRVADPDGDLVAGSIRANGVLVGTVRSGASDLALPGPGPHALAAELDDGAGIVAFDLGVVP